MVADGYFSLRLGKETHRTICSFDDPRFPVAMKIKFIASAIDSSPKWF